MRRVIDVTDLPFDLHGLRIEPLGGSAMVTARRYNWYVSAQIQQTALEDCASPVDLLARTVQELAESLYGLPIVDHDPGDEDVRR